MDAWGTVTKKRAVLNVATAPEYLNYHKHTPEGARDYKLLQKKLANFKMGNYTSLKKLHPPEKGFGGPPNLYQDGLVTVLSIRNQFLSSAKYYKAHKEKGKQNQIKATKLHLQKSIQRKGKFMIYLWKYSK